MKFDLCIVNVFSLRTFKLCPLFKHISSIESKSDISLAKYKCPNALIMIIETSFPHILYKQWGPENYQNNFG